MALRHEAAVSEEILERVKQRRGRTHVYDRLAGAATALVVIDMQNAWVMEGQPAYCPYCPGIVDNINRLARAVRDAGGLVVWIKTHNTEERERTWPIYYEFFAPEMRERMRAALTDGDVGAELWHELDARPQDAVVVKTRFSAFIQGSSELEQVLRRRGIDTVAIAGTATNVCCESSARDAHMLNFKTVMVADANAARSDSEHNASLDTLFLMFADVMTTDEVVARLAQGAGSEAAE